MKRSAIRETITYLVEQLGETLVAVLSDVTDRSQIATWQASLSKPSPESWTRLSVAEEVFRRVADTDGPDTARSWFVGANVGDELTSPAEAIRDGRFEEVRLSCQRLIDESWS